MKLLLFAIFIIYTTASSVSRSKNISVNDDGTILITTPYGKRVSISRLVGLNGQKNIDISVSGPNIPPRTIQINDNNLYETQTGGNNPLPPTESGELRFKRGSKSKTQGDILCEILQEFQGVVDEPQFEQLLNRINTAVRKGLINPQIYYLFLQLDQELFSGDQGGSISGQGIYGYGCLNGGYGCAPSGLLYGALGGYQIPYVLGGQYYGNSRYVNPLLEQFVGANQANLLSNQQLNGGIVSRLGYGYGPLLRGGKYQLFNEIPYGQRQTVGVLPQVQQIEQLGGVPQVILQQQQQIGQLLQTEQALEQLQQAVESSKQLEQQPIVPNVPLVLQQLIGVPQYKVISQQPFYGVYRSSQPWWVQGRLNSYPYSDLSTLQAPQPQVVY